MNLYIETRVLNIADYIIETGATVRAAAGVFGVSKSTVHKDITERLRTINKALAEKVAAVLEVNREERHAESRLQYAPDDRKQLPCPQTACL